jgi:HAD superfamily hydrolase (TIGR01509 family)
MKPTTLIFDLSEVLIAGMLGVEKPLALLLGLSEPEVLDILGRSPLVALFIGELSEDAYLAQLLAQSGWPCQAEVLKDLLRENFRQVIPGMPELLEHLAGEYELVLVSDHAREWVAYIETIHAFLNRFDRRFYSFYFRQTKKQPGTFQALLREIGREPRACLFIDDSKPNLRAAQALGIAAIRFQDPAQLRAALRERGVLD